MGYGYVHTYGHWYGYGFGMGLVWVWVWGMGMGVWVWAPHERQSPPGRYDVQKLELAAHVAAPRMLDWRTKACEQSLMQLNQLSAVHLVAKVGMFAKKQAIANLQYGIHNVCYYNYHINFSHVLMTMCMLALGFLDPYSSCACCHHCYRL